MAKSATIFATNTTKKPEIINFPLVYKLANTNSSATMPETPELDDDLDDDFLSDLVRRFVQQVLANEFNYINQMLRTSRLSSKDAYVNLSFDLVIHRKSFKV